MSRILVDQIRSNSASADALSLDGSGNITVPGNLVVTGNANCNGTPSGFGDASKLVNYAQEFKTDNASQTIGWITYSGNNWTNDLIYLDYAAANTNNKLLIISHLSYHVEDGYNYTGFFGFMYIGGSRASTAGGDSSSGRNRASFQHNVGVTNNTTSSNDNMSTAVHNYLHSSPSTSTTRYSWRFAHTNSGGNKGVYLNRTHAYYANAAACTATSSITIMEFLP